MRFNHVTMMVISGFIWFVIGIFLLIKGLSLLVLGAHFVDAGTRAGPLFKFIALYTRGGEQAALILIASGLLLGFIKGRWVLSKTVKRVVHKILSLPAPVKLTDIYNAPYYFLILLMMGLGFAMKVFHFPNDIRGLIDVAVGSALMNGALLYFRCALSSKQIGA